MFQNCRQTPYNTKTFAGHQFFIIPQQIQLSCDSFCFCPNEIRRGTVDVISVHFFFDGEIRLQFMIVTFPLPILSKSVRNILYNYKRCLRYIYLFDLWDACHKYF